MERNDFASDASTQGQTAGTNAGGTFGNAGSSETFGDASGSGSQTETGGFSDRARDLAGTAKDKLADVGSTARDRAGQLKESLAGALESSAEKLRQRASSPAGQLDAATGHATIAIENDGRIGEAATKVAGGMDATAAWLRDADIEGMKAGIEKQIKEHPGRTLLIAVGLGYLVGKAFRK